MIYALSQDTISSPSTEKEAKEIDPIYSEEEDRPENYIASRYANKLQAAPTMAQTTVPPDNVRLDTRSYSGSEEMLSYDDDFPEEDEMEAVEVDMDSISEWGKEESDKSEEVRR